MSQRFDTATQTEAALSAAVAAVEAGECIVLPTDTVYGIGADAFSPTAVQGLLDAKQRGRDMPPPVLLSDAAVLESLAANIDPRVWLLAEAFWPGPLTLIVAVQPSLQLDLGENGATIGVRVPDHEVTRELLRRTGPLAVSSANISAHPAAQSIEEAIEQLGESVAVYLDAGPSGGPVPSTILDMTGIPAVLREGRLTIADLEEAVPGLFPPPATPGVPDIEVTEADLSGPQILSSEPAEAPEPPSADAK